MPLSLASVFIWYSYSLSFRTARREHKKPWETQEQSSFHLPPPPPQQLLAHSTLALTQGGANSDRSSNRTGYTICKAQCIKKMWGTFFQKVSLKVSLKTVTAECETKHRPFWAWGPSDRTGHMPMKLSLSSNLFRRGKTGLGESDGNKPSPTLASPSRQTLMSKAPSCTFTQYFD